MKTLCILDSAPNYLVGCVIQKRITLNVPTPFSHQCGIKKCIVKSCDFSLCIQSSNKEGVLGEYVYRIPKTMGGGAITFSISRKGPDCISCYGLTEKRNYTSLDRILYYYIVHTISSFQNLCSFT